MIINTIKKIKENYFCSKDTKTLINNFAYLSLLQISGYIFPIITYPYLAKIIGLSGFGSIAFASSIIIYCMTITDWGFMFTATRDVAQNRNNLEKISHIFSTVTCARFFLMFISFLLLLTLIFFIPVFRESSIIILITFLLIPGHILFPEWLFQGLERMKYITILNFLSKFLFTLLTFIFINDASDYILQPLFISLGYIVSGIIALYYITVKWKIKFKIATIKEVINTIKSNFDVFINNFFPNLYNSFSVIILGFLGGNISNGIYSAADKVIAIFNQFILIFSRTFFPFLSRKIEKHSIFVKYNLTIGALTSIAIFFFSPLIIKLLYSNEFNEAIPVLRIISFSIFFMTLSNTYGTNYLIIQRKEKTLRKITMRTSVFGFFLAITLIYYFGYFGAAISITTTRAILASNIAYNAIRHKRLAKRTTNPKLL